MEQWIIFFIVWSHCRTAVCHSVLCYCVLFHHRFYLEFLLVLLPFWGQEKKIETICALAASIMRRGSESVHRQTDAILVHCTWNWLHFNEIEGGKLSWVIWGALRLVYVKYFTQPTVSLPTDIRTAWLVICYSFSILESNGKTQSSSTLGNKILCDRFAWKVSGFYVF